MEDILEEARKQIVYCMKAGATLVISMGPSSFDLIGTFGIDDTKFPKELLINSGLDFVNAPAMSDTTGKIIDKEMTTKLFRDTDTSDCAGIALCREGFRVVVSSHFEAEDIDDFLFSGDYGLIPKSNFKVLKCIIK